MFTNRGSFIYLPIFKLPELKWKDLGQHVSNLVSIDSEEKIISAHIIQEFKADEYFLFSTSNGLIKRTRVSDFGVSRYNRAMVAMGVKEDDVLVNVSRISEKTKENIVMVTQKGYLLKFQISELAPTGLKAMGLKGIQLGADDKVIKTITAVDREDLLLLTNRGNIKKVKVKTFPLSSRNKKGNLGIKTIKTNPHQFIDCIKLASNHEVSIKTEKEDLKLDLSLYKAVDLNSVGTNLTGNQALRFIIEEKE